jgi:hypothetical protein
MPQRDKNVDSWMYEHDPSVRQIALAVREIIFSALPNVRETIKWSQPVFRTDRDLFYINATQRYVTLGFFDGGALTDPGGRLEGYGQAHETHQDPSAGGHRTRPDRRVAPGGRWHGQPARGVIPIAHI